MKILGLLGALLAFPACAATPPSPTPPREDRSVRFVEPAEPETVLRIEEDGRILLRGKEIGKDPAAYASLMGFIQQTQSQLLACKTEQLKKDQKPAKK